MVSERRSTQLKAALYDLVTKANFDRSDPELRQAEDLLTAAIKDLERLELEADVHVQHRPQPYRCPNCNGAGERVYQPLGGGPVASYTINLYPAPQQCHSCKGTGVLWR